MKTDILEYPGFDSPLGGETLVEGKNFLPLPPVFACRAEW